MNAPLAPASAAIGRPPAENLAAYGNISGFFEHWVAKAPMRAALIDPEGRAWSYAELDARARRLAQGLTQRGFRPGDRCLMMVPASVELFTILLALSFAGGCAVLLDPRMGRKRLRHTVASASPRWFITVPRGKILRLLVPEIRRIPKVVTAGKSWFGPTVDELVSDSSADFETVRVEADSEAMLSFTSGSTGEPKGVLRSQRMLNDIGDAVARAHTAQVGDVDMSSISGFVLYNFAAGVTSVLPRVFPDGRADVPGILQQIAEHRVTTLGGAPRFVEAVARGVLANPGSTDSIRWVGTGGARISKRLMQLLRDAFVGVPIEAIYGATECEPMCLLDGDELLSLSETETGVCVGYPTADLCVSIDRPDAQGVGEILVKGARVQREYFKNPQATEAAGRIIEGERWHRTGDLGRLDEQSRVWLLGRAADVLHLEGRPLYSHVVEGVVEACAGVERAGLCEVEGQVLVGVQPEAGSVQAELATLITAALADAGLPAITLRFVDEVPVERRHASKVDRARLRAKLGGKQG